MFHQRNELKDPALARVHALMPGLVSAHGVELVDLRWVTEHGARTLRVTIERRGASDERSGLSEGWGVTLDDCANFSRDLSAALDQEEGLPARYHLEVSSPGLDRELHSVDDLRRFRGRLARVKLARPAPDGQRVLRGALGEVGDATLTMTVDHKRLTVPLADVVEASLVFELLGADKPSHRGRSKAARAGGAGRPKSQGQRGTGSESVKRSGS